MFYISEIMTSEPQEYKNQLQKETYKALAQLKIPFERVDTDEAVTMDDCVLIDQKLNMKMVKTLFLCNRKKTIFYLFVTTGEKAFDTKNFSNAFWSGGTDGRDVRQQDWGGNGIRNAFGPGQGCTGNH